MERYCVDAAASCRAGFLACCVGALLWSAPVTAQSPGGVWGSDYEAAVQQAKSSQRPILVSVTATWCGPCQQLKQLTLNDREILQIAQQKFVAVSIDGDRRSDLVSKFGVTAYPTTFVLNVDGTVKQRWVGFQSASSFRRELERLAPESPKSSTLLAASNGTQGTVGGKGSQGQDAAGDQLLPVSAIFPANSSPFEFGGFCLVSLLDDNKLRRGTDVYYAEHKGVRVSFFSAEHRAKFAANPDRYWPVANGNCLVTSRETQENLPGDPRVGVLWKNRLWFFANRDRQRQFIESPQRFANGL